MIRSLVFRPQAVKEIEEAAEWYEKRAPGLSAEFLRALDATVALVWRNPLQFPAVHKQLRRAMLRRFPYSLIFSISDDEIVVIACAHWRQDARRWRNRG